MLNVLKKACSKRALSLILSLSLILPFFMPTSVQAAEGDIYTPDTYESLDELLQENPSYSGFVFQYNAPNTNDNMNGENIVRLDLGVYHIGDTESLAVMMHYDPEVASLAYVNKDTKAISKVTIARGSVSNAQKLSTLIPWALPRSAVGSNDEYIDDLPKSNTFDNSENGFSSTAEAPFTLLKMADAATMTLPIESNKFTGTFGFNLLGAAKPSDAEYFKLVDPNEETRWNTKALDEVLNLCSVYFIVDDVTKITPSTFAMVETNRSTTGMSSNIAGRNEDITTLAFLGFKQEVKAPEKYTNINAVVLGAEPEDKTDSSTWTDVLEGGGAVKIYYGADDHAAADRTGTPVEYTISTAESTKGQLLSKTDGTVAALTMYENEKYLWTVEPTDSTLAAAMGEATATKNGDKIVLWAQAANPVTYTLNIGGNAGNLQGATVTVTNSSGGSVTTSGTSDVNGNVTFQGYPGLTYNVTVTAPNYQTITGTVTTKTDGSAAIDTYGGDLKDVVSDSGQIVLPEPKTSIKVTVKYLADDEENADAVVPGATVTVIGSGNRTADASGVVNLNLGSGTYTLRASGGGRGTGANRTLVIGESSVTLDGTPIVASSGTYEVELRVGQKLKDPVYMVNGEWVNTADHSQGMKFTVTVENVTAAMDGTFGFQWDSKVFQLAESDFVPNTDAISLPQNKASEGLSFAFENPFVPTDSDEKSAQYQYHAFYWQAKYDETNGYTYLDASSGGVKIAEYTLKPAAGVTDIDSVLNDKTVTIRSFLKTSGAKAVNTEFDAVNNPSIALDAMSMFWQNINQTDYRNTGDYALSDDKALDGGFYQITQSAADSETVEGATVHGQDIMMTIQYPSTNLAVKFNVTDPAKQPIPGAKVTLQDENGNPITDADGNEISGTTDAYGDVTLQVPADSPEKVKEYYYSVKKNGFKKYPNGTENPGVKLEDEADETTGELPDVIEVELEPDDSAKVFLNPNARLNLLGSDRAPQTQDYKFNVQAKPGYVLKTGGLKTSDFEVKIWKLPVDSDGNVTWTDGTDPNDSGSGATLDNTADIQISSISWDSATNNFVIPQASIKVANGYLIEIIVKNEETNVPEADGYKVFAKADAAGGFFTVDPVADGSKFYAGTDTGLTGSELTNLDTTHQHDTIEKLKAGGTTSSTYFIQTNGPVAAGYTGTSQDKINAIDNTAVEQQNGQYYGYVINKLYVNGVELQLTDPERIHGVEETLVGISEDQHITVTYRIAKIDGKDTDNPTDDEIIEESDPVGDGLVTLVLGQYGSAEYTYDTAKTGTQSAGTTVDYTVTGATFSATITAASSVANPDGTSGAIDYEIDKIYVVIDDGLPQCIFSDDVPGETGSVETVTTLPNGITWTGDSSQPGTGTSAGFKKGTVEVSNLAAGKHVTILVTFKVDGEAAMQAWVQTVNNGGNGSVSPSGLLAYNIGAEPVFTIMPDSGWSLSALTVQVDNGSINGRKSDVVEKDGVLTYKMEPLQPGTTKLAYTFTENSFRVNLTVHYGDMKLTDSPYTHAKIAYTRTAGGDGTDKSGTIAVAPTVTTKNAVQQYAVDLLPGTWTITVTKNGYLPFTIENFTIQADGTVAGTDCSADESGVKVINFGTTATDKTAHYIAPKIGDADWNGISVNLRDISQMVNGMSQNAAAASKAHADLNESGSWPGQGYDLTFDYGYVIGAYGAKWTDYVMDYSDFIANETYNPANPAYTA